MTQCQAPTRRSSKPMYFEVLRQRVAPLSLVNHFLKRLRIESRPEKCVPTTDQCCLLPYAKGHRLGMSLRLIIVEREAIYRQQETVETWAAFSPYLLALLVRALSERELRLAMKREQIAGLPLCPEQRLCRHGFTHSADYDVLDLRKEVSRPRP